MALKGGIFGWIVRNVQFFEIGFFGRERREMLSLDVRGFGFGR